LKDFKELDEKRDSILKWIKEYSPAEHATKQSPPIALFYTGSKDAAVGAVHPDPTHSPVMGMKLQEKLKGLGVDVVLSYTGHPDTGNPNAQPSRWGRWKAEPRAPPVVAKKGDKGGPQAQGTETLPPPDARPSTVRRGPLQRLMDRIRRR